MKDLLPNRMVSVFIKLSNLISAKKANQITKKDKHMINLDIKASIKDILKKIFLEVRILILFLVRYLEAGMEVYLICFSIKEGAEGKNVVRI